VQQLENILDSGRPALIVYDDLSKKLLTVRFLFIEKTTGT
jgi:F0F1-type ATP synthase alpha subunit